MNPILTPVLYLLPLAGITVSLIVIARSGQQRGGPSRLDPLFDSLSSIGAAITQRFGRNAVPAGGR